MRSRCSACSTSPPSSPWRCPPPGRTPHRSPTRRRRSSKTTWQRRSRTPLRSDPRLMSRVGARREREGTVPRATAVPRLATRARHAGYARRVRLRRVKLGLFLPLHREQPRVGDLLAVAATTAERTGFHSLWFAEHVALFGGPASRYPYSADGSFPLSGEAGILEPFLAIGFAAALTSRIRLGTGICLVPQRPPLY